MALIYVIEDDAKFGEILTRALDAHDIEVFQTGEIGLNALKHKKPDAVVLDLMLPGKIQGVDIAKKLGEMKIPYIVITASGDPGMIVDAIKHGASAYIEKPMQKPYLQRIRNAITTALASPKDLLGEAYEISLATGYIMRDLDTTPEQAAEIFNKESQRLRMKKSEFAREVIAKAESKSIMRNEIYKLLSREAREAG